MGQMADGGGYVVMLPVIQDQRNGPHPGYQSPIPVQLFGGYGYIREYDVERMMRDAKITESMKELPKFSVWLFPAHC